MKPAIKIEDLSKQYRLGLVGTGTLSHDLKRWWHLLLGKEDPYLKIGETNDRSTKGNSQYVWALKDINLEVMPGEVLGIIGRNGAGKSTLLKILSKVTGPTTGKIDYRGRIGSLLEVGTGFHHELTGRENIYLNGAILGMRKKEIDRKFDEIVDFSGCERYIDTPVKRYSSGMTVRMGFAVAAFLEPEILVVDEVLAVGDAEFQKKAIGKMQDVSKNEGRTVLFVSHNMATIESICTKATLIESGSMKYISRPSEVISKYLSANTKNLGAEFINRNPNLDSEINLISACLFDDNFQKRDYFNNNEDIFVELEVCINSLSPYMKIGIELMESGWNKIFTFFHSDVDHINQLKEKKNTITYRIPKNLLNKGNYTLNIQAGIHRKNWLFNYENLLQFTINFQLPNQTMPIDRKIGCLIAPILECNIK